MTRATQRREDENDATEKTTMANQETIRKNYEQAKNDVDALLDWLRDEAKGHAEHANAETMNYGHVGDMLRTREGLMRVLSELSGHDAGYIENELNETDRAE
jgi:hypothetical protein